MNKRCIFHIPNKLDDAGKSGSQVRPRKMIAAFKNIGYDVDVIMGYGQERAAGIAEIKKNILNGIKYDFVYSESSTMPTLLTEKHHYPTYPNLDFGFFSFCKKHGLKIGLFYRDMHWKFPRYRNFVRGFKLFGALLAYKYDLYRYESLLDIFYTPTKLCLKYVNHPKLSVICETLPPGAVFDNSLVERRKAYFEKFGSNKNINIFYVGGIGGLYNFLKLMEAINDLTFVTMTICCREEEWEKEKHNYENFITDRITIIHKSEADLEKYYDKADLCALIFDQDEYAAMSMPVKLFEYLSHITPIISTKGTAFAEFIENNDIGWCVDYDVDAIRKLLVWLYENKREIIQKHRNMINVLKENTWEKRAKKVARDLVEE